MTDWYRNTRWSPEIEAAFEAKLSRSRTQKAQYLRIQGAMLKETHPAIAVRLLDRCIEIGDQFFVAPALLDRAQAYLNLHNLGLALDSLEAAMEQEAREPKVRTSAAFDFAMLVVMHDQADRFDKALACVEGAIALMPVMEFQREAARAIILHARGCTGEARASAERALLAEARTDGGIPSFPDVGTVPNRSNPLSVRIRALLSA
jgi:tetratricopeptide (TPR) repeat protein